MPSRHVKSLLGTVLAAALTLPAAAQDNVRLPDLGSSANALISPGQAQDYGAAMLRQMRALDMVVDDPLLDGYINDVGYRLVANSDEPGQRFTFFIVKDAQINAFAAPGGYIAVNSGLMTITRNESELASVLAHEIGHITQKHMQRAFEESKKNAPLMALVMLGAIAAGAASDSSDSNGDAMMAVLAGGQGLIAQKSINFTRHDEIEADHVGIQTLARAGYDPEAMASFFQRMQDAMSAGAGGLDVPELLRSHPVTSNRISDAKARAGALIAAQKLQLDAATMDRKQWEKTTAPVLYLKDPSVLADPARSDRHDSTYALMRERVRVLAGDPSKLAKWYADNLASHKSFDTTANRYGYALALNRSGQAAVAVHQLQPLLQASPGNRILQLAMARARLLAGQREASLAIYRQLHQQSPRDHAVALDYAAALTRDGTTEQASLAASLLRPLLDSTDDPEIYTTYARASEKAGDDVRAGEAYADASYYAGRPYDAMEQLKRLLARTDLDYYARARIQARISYLTPLLMELSKRRIPTRDRPDADQQGRL